ncbi:MAG: glycine--tRNA ligase subunit beta [Caulobacteraceae bacterium]
MPQLLLELLSEDIPARFQLGAARDLERLAREKLAEGGLDFSQLRAFAGPRRLTLVVDGLPSRQPDRTEERKGPRLGAPPAALEGFLRSIGLDRGALVEREGAYFAVTERPGEMTPVVIAGMVEELIRQFPWPKSMRWGSGVLRWVRPLHRVLCVFDRTIVPLAIEDLVAGDISEGHRFMGAVRPFRARDFAEYREALSGHFVVLSAEEREGRIREGALALCRARGLELVDDGGLLKETAGLAEWPVPIMGDMDPAFLSLPAEVIRTSMRVHQRYFAVQNGEGALAPHFVMIANIEPTDGGKLIAAGAARVLSARLADARFFFEEDQKTSLEARLEKLKGVTFHAELGTLYDRAVFIDGLAGRIARRLGADERLARRAGLLAKADLTSAMVGEFPELQGVMGSYYALADGEHVQVAAAIGEHYRPQGPDERIPNAPVSVAVALADKLDSLVAFFAIGERPTGSRDPFALRRAAIGVIRIILEKRLRLPLRALLAEALDNRARTSSDEEAVMAFVGERLKVLLRERGARHDLVDSVFALGDDDLVRAVARIEALAGFLATEDGANLLAGFKRASNILVAEAKKGSLPKGDPRLSRSAPTEERTLYAALAEVRPQLKAALAEEGFAVAMSALASLRAPLDAFFDKVLVNSPVPAERAARLRLLAGVRAAMGQVADFSKISG